MTPDPDAIQGFLSRREGRELARLAAGRLVLEVGCWKGRSTVHLARHARGVYSIDHFRGDAWTGPAFTLPEAVQNLADHGVRDRVCLLAGCMRDLLPLLDLSGFGLAFYDAGHSCEETAWALAAISRTLPASAPVAVHDYEPGAPAWADTVRAVDEYRGRTGRRLRLVDRLAVLEAP